jgi:signal peptidase I
MNYLKIVYYSGFAFIALIALLLIVSTFPISGNIKVMIVQSGSMEPAIRMGSVVVAKPMDSYKAGDIITFELKGSEYPVTHRIQDIGVVEGKRYYITKGDANEEEDQTEIRKEDIFGKVLVAVPYLGYAINFAQKPIGFALVIIIPGLIIIADEVKKIIREVKKDKKKKEENNL